MENEMKNITMKYDEYPICVKEYLTNLESKPKDVDYIYSHHTYDITTNSLHLYYTKIMEVKLNG